MRSVNVSEFRQQVSSLLDELPPDGILVTRRGKPLARLVPVRQPTGAHLIGALKGKLKIHGNIFSTGRKWDAQSGYRHRAR